MGNDKVLHERLEASRDLVAQLRETIARLARELEEAREEIRRLVKPIIEARPAAFGGRYDSHPDKRKQGRGTRRTVVWSEPVVQTILSSDAVRVALAGREGGE